jgi:hypothetical protein
VLDGYALILVSIVVLVLFLNLVVRGLRVSALIDLGSSDGSDGRAAASATIAR